MIELGENVAVNGRMHFLKEVSVGNLLSVGTVLIASIFAYATLHSDVRALAQRADKSDKIDEKTGVTLDTLRGGMIRIEVEQQNVRKDQERLGRQLDRIEYLLRNGGPAPPPKTP